MKVVMKTLHITTQIRSAVALCILPFKLHERYCLQMQEKRRPAILQGERRIQAKDGGFFSLLPYPKAFESQFDAGL